MKNLTGEAPRMSSRSKAASWDPFAECRDHFLGQLDPYGLFSLTKRRQQR